MMFKYMIDILILSIVVSFSTTAGGIISLYTKSEIKIYKKWINLSEKILLIILSLFLITIYKWTIAVIFLGLAIPLLKIKKINLVKYTTIGIAIGTMFALNAQASYFLGALITIPIILNSTLLGYISKKSSVFKEIGKYQAIFIIASIFAFLISTTPFVKALLLNAAAGIIVVSALSS